MNLIPFSMVNAYAYCPKRFYIEYILGDFEESADTVEGKIKHEHADSGKASKKKGKRTRVYISSEKYALHGFLDVLEESNSVSIVEYKKGKYGNWFNDKAQLCAEVMAYEEETSLKVDHAYLYYISSKKKVEIECKQKLREQVLRMINDMVEMTLSEKPPKVNISKKCARCSLFHICMPTLSKSGRTSFPIQVRKQNGGSLVVTQQGSYIGIENGKLTVSTPVEKRSFRLNEIGDLEIYGNVVISTPAVKRLSDLNKNIHVLTYFGNYVGSFFSKSSKNVVLRLAQYKIFGNESKKLEISSKFVEGKLKNMIGVVKKRWKDDIKAANAIKTMERFHRKIKKAKNVEELMGIEGTSSATYFEILKRFVPKEFNFEDRNRRPPRDPVNAMLSFGYSILLAKVISAVEVVGFDPYIGFMHSLKYGKPSLALDIMEEFRPIIVDTVILTLLGKKEISPKDFLTYSNGVFLKSRAKKILIGALNKRLSTVITHPYVGYKMTYQRVIEAQCRILAKTLLGEIEYYIPFKRRV